MRRVALVILALLVGLTPTWRTPPGSAQAASPEPAATSAGWVGTITQEYNMRDPVLVRGIPYVTEHWILRITKNLYAPSTWEVSNYTYVQQLGSSEVRITASGSGTTTWNCDAQNTGIYSPAR